MFQSTDGVDLVIPNKIEELNNVPTYYSIWSQLNHKNLARNVLTAPVNSKHQTITRKYATSSSDKSLNSTLNEHSKESELDIQSSKQNQTRNANSAGQPYRSEYRRYNLKGNCKDSTSDISRTRHVNSGHAKSTLISKTTKSLKHLQIPKVSSVNIRCKESKSFSTNLPNMNYLNEEKESDDSKSEKSLILRKNMSYHQCVAEKKTLHSDEHRKNMQTLEQRYIENKLQQVMMFVQELQTNFEETFSKEDKDSKRPSTASVSTPDKLSSRSLRSCTILTMDLIVEKIKSAIADIEAKRKEEDIIIANERNELLKSKFVIRALQIILKDSQSDYKNVLSEFNRYKLRIKSVMIAKNNEVRLMKERTDVYANIDSLLGENMMLKTQCEEMKNQNVNLQRNCEEFECKASDNAQKLFSALKDLEEVQLENSRIDIEYNNLLKKIEKERQETARTIMQLKLQLQEKDEALLNIECWTEKISSDTAGISTSVLAVSEELSEKFEQMKRTFLQEIKKIDERIFSKKLSKKNNTRKNIFHTISRCNISKVIFYTVTSLFIAFSVLTMLLIWLTTMFAI